MNINPETVDNSVVAMLATRSSRPVGLVESPTGTWKYPVYIVYPAPSLPAYGSLANPNDMGDWAYQITIVGETLEQCSKAEARAFQCLCDYWADVAGACGPPLLSRRGTVRVQDNLYQAILIAELKVSAL